MTRKAVLALFCVCAAGLAANPIELLKSVNSDLLEDYSRPLVESYGVAMGTGWYHSGRSHKFLGFDIGVRTMLINIPDAARTFTASVMACSARTGGGIDTFYVDVEGAATIFGPGGEQPVNPPGEYALAIPPTLPGGLNMSWMPFLVPQASLGLPLGLEVTARYIPWPFEGTTVQFFGVGVKEEITTWVKLPVHVSVQGFYQSLAVGNELNSTTFGGNIHLGRSLLFFAPYAGVGFDKTKTDIDYVFTGRFPTGVGPNGIETEELEIPVVATYDQPVNLRATLGVALKFGLAIVNADYNYNLTTGYHAATVGLGIGMR